MHYAIIGLLTLGLVALVPASEPEQPIEDVQTIAVEQVETPEPTSEPTQEPKHITKELTWQDNPNGCQLDTQYVREDNLECIEKPAVVSKTTTPVTQVATGNCEAYRSLVSQYNWDVETMLYAMRLESGCNPNAVGDNYAIGGIHAPSCGLLQVRTLPGRPTCEELKNPAKNVETAYIIWTTQGYNAWSVLH